MADHLNHHVRTTLQLLGLYGKQRILYKQTADVKTVSPSLLACRTNDIMAPVRVRLEIADSVFFSRLLAGSKSRTYVVLL